MSNTNRKKEAHMATSSVKRKSAMDTLLESMDELVDSAAERMTAEELQKARKEINDGVDRALASHKRRRETA
jgi:F0F1-type ATP synthase membrane subunit b/b'